MVRQAKLNSFRTAVVYKYGFRVPRNHDQAMEYDRENGNTRWRDSEVMEVEQLHEYSVFGDKGFGGSKPTGYKMIRCHLVYDVKHDARHKSRLVAGGHLTDTPLDSVYSGVVSLRSVRMIAFLAEHNEMELWATDIGNAYLEAYTSEKVCIIAGGEFGELAGHLLVIIKALYGLKSSGLRWSERFSAVLRDMGFKASYCDPCVWMRDRGDHYEYLGVYVDDLEIASRSPNDIIQDLLTTYKFKLKGTGPMTYHLGCDFTRDGDNVLVQSPKKYLERTFDEYTRIFGEKPRVASSPLEKGDHPEIDTTAYLGFDDIKKYQSVIGSLQWAISLGRFDIATAVMTLSAFRAVPRKGHLERARRVVGYLYKMRHAAIRYRTQAPDFSDLPETNAKWDNSVYGDVKELLPHDLPEPKGKPVTTTTYVDANLYHCLMTGRSVTGIIHLLNKTAIEWFSKKQGTVETATYGSEFVAARIGTEQLMDLRNTLRYLGVPITASLMFGDNKSVVDSSMIPHSQLNKRHTALSYHRVREAICADVFKFYHIYGTENPSDVLSKHWGYSQVWHVLQPILFFEGDTMDLKAGN
jgi:hypothetical protein